MTSPNTASSISEASSLPDEWNAAVIGELFKFSSGKTRPRDVAEVKSDSKPYPVFGGNGVMGFAAEYLIEKPTLILGRVGVYCGCSHHSEGAAWISDNALYAKWVAEQIDTHWARYFFEHANLNQYSSRAAQPLVSQGMLAGIRMPVPPKSEQRQIARVLSAVQRATGRQERLIALAAELKKALMHKLFTEGTHGEPLKQTKIGLMPESWAPTPLGSLFAREPSNGMYRPQSDYGRGKLILRIDDFSNDGDIVKSAANRVRATADDLRRFGLNKGDIVLNRVNSLSHLGKTALIEDLAEPMLFESNMMRFRVDEERVRSKFAFRVLNSPVVKSQVIGVAKRAVAQSSVNQGDVAKLIVPLPPNIAEQDVIISAIDSVEAKRSVHLLARITYDNLFRTLLHQLMTAKIRVDVLDLPAMDELALEPAGVT